MRVYMTIHALSTWNEEGKRQGHCDTPLSDSGRKAAELLASRPDLAEVRTIFTSDLQRSVQTAAPLAARLGLVPVKRTDLREGNWADYHIDPLFPPMAAPYGFETVDELNLRCRSFLRSLRENPVPSPLLVVTHGGFFRLMLTQVLGVPLENYKGIRTALNVIELRRGEWQVISLNDDSHLLMSVGAINNADSG